MKPATAHSRARTARPKTRLTMIAALLAFGTCAYVHAQAPGQSTAAQQQQCHQTMNEQMRQHEAIKRQRQIDVQAQFNIDMRNCGIDRGCKTAAIKRYQDGQREIANWSTRETAEIRKANSACMAAIRGGPLGDVFSTNGNPDNGRPAPSTTPTGSVDPGYPGMGGPTGVPGYPRPSGHPPSYPSNLPPAYPTTQPQVPVYPGRPAQTPTQPPARPPQSDVFNTGAAQDDKLPCAPKNLTHLRLYNEPWLTDPRVKPTLDRSLQAVKGSVQSNKLARGKAMAFDEYSITIKRMPGGYTPEKLIQSLATEFNITLEGMGPAGNLFGTLAPFKRRTSGTPRVGEIVDINIPGDPGSVQLVEKTANHFVYQTVTTPELGTHPVSGAREFGFWRNGQDIVVYTRGADRPYNDNLRTPGMLAQHTTWQSYVRGVGELVQRWGGVVDWNSVQQYREDIPCDKQPTARR